MCFCEESPSQHPMRLPILLFFLTAGLATTLPAKPLPLETFYDPPALTGVKISPSGKLLSMVRAKDGEQHLIVLDLANLQPKSIARLGFSRLANLWWTSENRILLLLDEPNGGGEFKSVDIATGQATTHFVGQYGYRWLIHEMPESPDKAIFATVTANFTGYELRELDLKTNRTRLLEKNPGQVRRWLLDARGNVIAAVEMTSQQYSLLHRAGRDTRWTKKPFGTPEEPKLEFLAVHTDQRRLLALDYSTDPSRLVAVDPVSLELEVIFAPEKFDFSSLENDGAAGGTPKSMLHPLLPGGRYHFTNESATLMQEIDRALPGTFNQIHSSSRDGRRLVIFSFSEHDPVRYHLLDRDSGRLSMIGSMFDGIDATNLGRGQEFNFPTTDGLTVYGTFIAPVAATRPPPLILLLEGGLYRQREGTSFSALRQAFATRGYAVATIDYRGTKGYGHSFSKLGRQQITDRIPLDLSEGVQWLAQQGWIDPERVIIKGEYGGGWVAMHALARTKNTYAGWINFGAWIGHEFTVDATKPVFAMADWDYWQSTLDLKASGLEQAPSLVKLLSEISVPAFHHYIELRSGMLISGGEHVRRILRTSNNGSTLVTRKPEHTIQDVRAGHLTVYEKLFAFLAEHFPTEQNPRPTPAGGRN